MNPLPYWYAVTVGAQTHWFGLTAMTHEEVRSYFEIRYPPSDIGVIVQHSAS